MTDLELHLRHLSKPGSWDCGACEQPWPCPAAKEQLAAEMPSLQLAMYAWLCFEWAADDLKALSVSQMYERFVGWVRAAHK